MNIEKIKDECIRSLYVSIKVRHEQSSNELRGCFCSQFGIHQASQPVRAVRTRRPWQVVLTMVACLLRHVLPLDRTHGGPSTLKHRMMFTVSPSPTTAMTTSVIIADLLHLLVVI